MAFLLALTPVGVLAEGSEMEVLAASGVLITEVQTGLGTGKTDKEYVELFNATDEEVELGGWQLWYTPESRTTPEPYRAVTLPDDTVLAPGEHTLLASDTSVVPAGVTPLQLFDKMIAAEGANVVLLVPSTAAVCQLEVVDALAWGAGLLGAGDPAISTPKTKDKVLSRKVSAEGYYQNTRNNVQDFASTSFSGSTSSSAYLGTPGLLNTQVTTTTTPVVPLAPGLDFAQPVTDPHCQPEPQQPPGQQPPQTTDPTEQPPATIVPAPSAQASQDGPVFPERSKGLASPHVTELLPNPAAPQTDAADEFIELYNSNSAIFELTGFKLVAGKRTYTFPSGTLMQPKSFVAYYSADTRLALSNSGGQVQLLDPFGNVIGQSDPYGTAKDGHAWAFANGTWQWTTSPTPNAANAIQAPATGKKKATATKASTTSGAVKGASAGSSAGATPVAGQVSDEPSGFSIHPVALALVGVFAILYGIYEYRGDLANKFHQFRTYRAARRSLRQKPAGRGGD